MTILSTLGGGLWIIPVLMLAGAAWFFYRGRVKSVHYYWYSAALVVAAIVTLLLMRGDR